MKSLLTICLLATISSSALADKLAIVGGKVFTGSEQGTLENATVLINGNKIVSVSASSAVPEGYQSIDASGKYVTPGLIGAYTQLGLVEVSSSAGTVDAFVSSNPVSSTGAAYDVSYAINPDSSLLAISRVEGFTSAVSGISRSDSLFHGLGAVITLSGTGDPVLKSRAFTAVNVGNGLLGGGSYGDVSVGVDYGIVQYRISSKCPVGSAIRAILTNGTVECELDNDGGGDITSVTVGNGLVGGGDVGDLSMSINTSYIQRRVQQGCDLGDEIVSKRTEPKSEYFCALSL